MPWKGSIFRGGLLQSEKIWQSGQDNSATDFFDFVACAHGFRRRAYLDVGGYFEQFFYMGEETDLAIRLRDRGWKIARGTSDPLHHLQPPLKINSAPNFYVRRNSVLFYYLRSPLIILPISLTATIAKGIIHAFRTSSWRKTLGGYGSAIRQIATGQIRREPVSWQVFIKFVISRRRR